MQVSMCSVRPCTKREKKTGDEREKRKQPPNIYASGLCGVRLCLRERKRQHMCQNMLPEERNTGARACMHIWSNQKNYSCTELQVQLG